MWFFQFFCFWRLWGCFTRAPSLNLDSQKCARLGSWSNMIKTFWSIGLIWWSSFKCLIFFGGTFPDVTEAFQLLPRRHLSLHHNGKGSLGRLYRKHQWCGYKPHQQLHPHPRFYLRYPLTNSSWVGCRASDAGGGRTRNRRDGSLALYH